MPDRTPGKVPAPAKRSTALAFEVEQEKLPDGSFRLTPKRVQEDREVGVKEAGSHLGLCKDTIYTLCELGEPRGLSAWKLPSKKGNSKWRISWRSVLGFRDRNRGQG